MINFIINQKIDYLIKAITTFNDESAGSNVARVQE